MELNEMEKRLIFQTEGYGKSDVTYELRMCLTQRGHKITTMTPRDMPHPRGFGMCWLSAPRPTSGNWTNAWRGK